MSQDRIESLQQLRAISDIIVASVLTMAVELVISWNNIRGVNDLDTAAQLIPLVVSGAFLLRSVYVWISQSIPQDSDSVDCQYWPDDSYYNWTNGDSNGDYVQPRRNMVYIGSLWDWAGQRPPSQHRSHSHSRRRRRRRAREDEDAADPSYVAYDAMGHMGDGFPQMSAAGVPQEPAPAATGHR